MVVYRENPPRLRIFHFSKYCDLTRWANRPKVRISDVRYEGLTQRHPPTTRQYMGLVYQELNRFVWAPTTPNRSKQRRSGSPLGRAHI